MELTQEHKDKIRIAHLGKKLSEQHKINISKSLIGKNTWMKGRKASKETIEKMSKARKGIPHNPQWNKKIGLANRLKNRTKEQKEYLSKINTGKNNPNYGLHRSEESKLKMSNTMKGRKFTLEHKNKLSEVKKVYFKNNDTEKLRMRIQRSKQKMSMRDSSIELKIGNYLKELGITYITQKYIDNIKHCYMCDIFIPANNLVIECDGDYWHNYPIGKELDHIRTKELEDKGFKVIRLWESDINLMSLDKFQEILKSK